MKKGISFALAALMAVSLMACGGGAAKSTTAAGTEKQTEKASEKAGETEAAKEQSKGEAKTIGVSLLNSTHVFYNSIESAMEEQAKEYGWTLDVQDAAGDANKQLGQVQDFITKKVDAIVIAPTNSAGSKSMIDFLKFYCTDNFEFSQVIKHDFNLHELEHTEYDVIVANFMIPNIKGKKFICTSSLTLLELVEKLNVLFYDFTRYGV